MNIRQKGRRQEEVRQAPVAEAIAVGTAAGGLVLGTMQAQGAQHDQAASETQIDQTPVKTVETFETSAPHDAPPVQPAADVPFAPTAPAAVAPPIEGIDHVKLDTPADPAGVAVLQRDDHADAAPQTFESQLVAELSQQMGATLTRVIDAADNGVDPATLGQTMAAEIVQSAQQIVANLDIDALLGQTQSLGEGIVADALGATSGIADTVLAQVIDLPSALLGNESSDAPGGLLADIFYSDGGADTLAIPDLSEAASTLVGDIGHNVSGLLGVSYIDVQDHQGSHGLNALNLL